MNRKYHSRKVRQLDRLINEMKKAIRAGQSRSFIDRIRFNIALLIKELRGVLSSKQLAHKLGALAIFFGIASASNAQQFAAPVENPFGFNQSSIGYIGGIATADLDNDGDYDLLMGAYEGTFLYYENLGSATTPVFDTATINPYGLSNVNYYVFLDLADIDYDGDLDIIAGEYGSLTFFENIGTATSPSFAAPVQNAFGLNSGNIYLTMPDVADFDNDGDYDLLAGTIEPYNVNIAYFENTGSVFNPSFGNPVFSPFNITLNSSYFFAPTTADLDGDGDLDLLLAENYANFSYYENTGNMNNPNFPTAQSNPFGLIGGAADIVFPTFVDIDDDGDYDILGNGYYGSLLFYENVEGEASIDELSEHIGLSPNPFQNTINISSDNELELIQVYDMKGKLVFTQESPSGSVTLDNLDHGMYMVHLTDISGKVSKKKMQKI